MGSIMRSEMSIRNVWKLLLHLGWEGTLEITERSLGVVCTDLCVGLCTTGSVRACVCVTSVQFPILTSFIIQKQNKPHGLSP
jgi:hypothetical protein